jgi:hypothetical protein
MKKKELEVNPFKFILPKEIFDFFEIIDIKDDTQRIDIFLDELSIKPEKNESEKMESKGFHPEIVIQDFPLRDRAVFLHVRRRKWLLISSGEIISRNWELVAQGTRFTKEFAVFLKGIFRQIPDQQ